MILTTHYMEEAEALSDRVGVMKDGRLLALGTPEELKVRTGCEKFEDAFIAIVKGRGNETAGTLPPHHMGDRAGPAEPGLRPGLPLVLLLLLSAIQTNVPVDLFAIDRLTPGISVFGLAFIALFSATLVARDQESALLQRLYTAPLTAGDFIFGYVLPLAPMAAVQAAVCYLAAIPWG